MKIQVVTPEIKYIPGRKNNLEDYMSRISGNEQANDKYCQQIRHYVIRNIELPGKLNLAKKEYLIMDNLLYIQEPRRGDYDTERLRLFITDKLPISKTYQR